MMWSLRHFDDILNKMKGLHAGTYIGRNVLFNGLKFINMTPLNNDSRKVQ